MKTTLFRYDGHGEDRAPITIIGSMMVTALGCWHTGALWPLPPISAESARGFTKVFGATAAE